MPKRYIPKKDQDDREQILREVLEFVRDYIKKNGHSPSITQIATGCYRSRSGIVRYLDLLEARGYLTRTPRLPRSISLLDKKRRL